LALARLRDPIVYLVLKLLYDFWLSDSQVISERFTDLNKLNLVKFDTGSKVSDLSCILQLPQLPLELMLALKVVKITISLRQSKSTLKCDVLTRWSCPDTKHLRQAPAN